MAPSWGTRFSAMSIFARILKRETMGTNCDRGGGVSSRSTPSTRSRIAQESSNGSRWMSLAPIRNACSQNLVDHADDAAVRAGRRRPVDLQDLVVGTVVVRLLLLLFRRTWQTRPCR